MTLDMSLARHYRTLGLRPGSSGREIKLAYRQLVRRYHPDINPDKQAIERFIKINNAYTAISEATSRLKRRQQEARISHPVTPAKEPTDWSSIRQPPEQPSSASGSLPSDLRQEPLDLENVSVESLKRRLKQLGIGRFSKEQKSQDLETSPFAVVDGFSNNASNSSAINHQDTQQIASSSPEQEADLKTEAYLQLKSLLQQQRYPRAIALIEGLAHRMPSDTEISQWQAIVYQRWGRALISKGQTRKAKIYLQKALRTDPNNSSLWSEINRDFWQLENIAKATRT